MAHSQGVIFLGGSTGTPVNFSVKVFVVHQDLKTVQIKRWNSLLHFDWLKLFKY